MARKITKYKYETTFEEEYWEKYLYRKLDIKEQMLLKSVQSENILNEKIEKIFNIGQKMNLYIPVLTNLHGNCIFESLQYFGLCENHENFRVALAYMMFVLKDVKGIIPIMGEDMSLSDLCSVFSNDVEYVVCSTDKKIYKYNYDLMCLDLSSSTSWTRIHVDLILTFIASLFNLKIIIINNNEYTHEINPINNQDTLEIYLGQIEEFHYIPLDKQKNNETCLKYNNRINMFHDWAQNMAFLTGNIEFEEIKCDDLSNHQNKDNITTVQNKCDDLSNHQDKRDDSPSQVHQSKCIYNDINFVSFE